MNLVTEEKSKRQFGVPSRQHLLMRSGSFQQEVVDRLLGYRWDHFITLTYRFGRPQGATQFSALHDIVANSVTEFRRKVMGKQKTKFFVFWVLEDADKSHPHVHLLTANLKIPQRDLQGCWKHGLIHCEEIDQSDESRNRLLGYVVKQAPYSLHPDSFKYTKGLHLLPDAQDTVLHLIKA